jgi:alpha,alpha-trehalose phosphorylase
MAQRNLREAAEAVRRQPEVAGRLGVTEEEVVKQADLVMALHLRGDAFTLEEKIANFAYYEARTTRDSSLSASQQAVVAAETGHLQLAYEYWAEAALTDLQNLHHNSGHGLHIASLAGGWTVAVAGFGGMRDHNGELAFGPRLPEKITRMRFRVVYRGRRLTVTVTHESATYRLEEGEPLDIRHHGRQVTVDHEDVVLAIPEPPKVDPVRQPVGCAPRRRART